MKTVALSYGSLVYKLYVDEKSYALEDIEVTKKIKKQNWVEYIACQWNAEILKVKCQWFYYKQTLLNNVF